MRATNWEFKNRAMVFGLIFGISFCGYFLDQQNSVAALANWLGAARGIDANLVARILFVLATFLLVVAALMRTWASSYLNAKVVYASEVKTASLVADGPYRHVRNPLYFANVLLAIGMGAMMSRTGFFVAIAAMLVFCLPAHLSRRVRLAGEPGRTVSSATEMPCPVCGPRCGRALPPPDAKASWVDGFKAEFWCWGFAISVAAFAITLNTTAFFVIYEGQCGCAVVVYAGYSTRKPHGARPADS